MSKGDALMPLSESPSPEEHEASPVTPRAGSFEWDRLSGIVRWSSSLEQLHGLPPGQFGGTFDDFIADAHPDDRIRVMTQVTAALETPLAPFRIGYRIVRPDGSMRWIESHGEVVQDSAGEVTGIRGVCMDVSPERVVTRLRDAASSLAALFSRETDIEDALARMLAIVGEAIESEVAALWAAPIPGGEARATWAREAEAAAALLDQLRPPDQVTIAELFARRSATLHPLRSPIQGTAQSLPLSHSFAIAIQGPSSKVLVAQWITASPMVSEQIVLQSLDTIATEASEFVRRLEAERRVLARERQHAAVAQLGRRALTGATEDELFAEATSLVAETLGVEFTKVLKLLPGESEVLLIAGTGWRDGLIGHSTEPTGAQSQAGFAILADRAVITHDLSSEDRFTPPALLLDHGVVAGISCVIQGDHGAWGVLGAHTGTPRTFTEDDAAFLESVANVLASAVERKRREHMQALLLEVSDLLATSLDPHETMNQLASILAGQMADWCVVHLVQDDRLWPIVAAHHDPAKADVMLRYRDQLREQEASPIIDAAIAAGHASLIPMMDAKSLIRMGVSSEAIDLMRSLGVRSGIIAPLIARGRTIGALTMISAESRRRYTSADLVFADELARRAAMAIDNGMLFDASERARQDLTLLASRESTVADLAQEALRTENFWELMQQISERLVETLGVDHAGVLELYPGRQILIRAGEGWRPGIVTEVVFEAGDLPEVEQALGDGIATWHDLPAEMDEPSSLAQEHEIRGLLVVSVPGPNAPWGALLVSSRTPREFTTGEAAFLRAVGGVLAGAIEMRRNYRAQAALARVAAALARQLDRLDVAEVLVTESLSLSLGADWSCLWLTDGAGQVTDVVTRHRDPERQALLDRLAREMLTATSDQAGLRYVLRTRQPRLHTLISEQRLAAEVPDPELRDALRTAGITSTVLVPLEARGRLYGVLAAGNGRMSRPFGAHDERVLVQVAERAALALQAVSLLEEARRERDVLGLIQGINRIISAELDREKLVQAVVDAATEVSGAAFGAFFYNVEDERGQSYQLYALAGADHEAFATFEMPRATPVFGPTFRGEGSVRSANIQEDPRFGQWPPFHGMPPGHLPVRSYLAVPVVDRAGVVLGGLFLGHSEEGVFDERATRIVEGIAVQAAIAFDNAELFEQTRLALRTQEDFVSLTSHELRNPLTSVLGFASQLERLGAQGQLDEQVAEKASFIYSEANRMRNSLALFIDMAGLDTGHFVTDRAEVDLGALVAREVAAAERRHPEATFEQHRPPSPVLVETDQSRVQTVLANLIGNAVKYGGAPPHVTVSVEGGDTATVRVRDNGAGIAAEDRDHVFERYYRGGGGRQESRPGLGLGLYLSKRIAEHLSARLDFTSQSDGTEFALVLPARTHGET